MEVKVKTNKVSAILGIFEGYVSDNNIASIEEVLTDISGKYQKIAEKNYLQYKKETGFECYISAVISLNATAYRKEWGCPDGGEATFSIECTRNPYFISDGDVYERLATKNILEMKELFKQSTVLIEYSEIACSYITSQNK